MPQEIGHPVVTTADPHDWFDLPALFRDAGADLRYHAALPGLLVGAGLMFTFLGLAAALSLAGGIVGAGSAADPAARDVALHNLLAAASVKFITSLAGLFFSITYALFRKYRLRCVEVAYKKFLSGLLECMPFRTAAFLQMEANSLLHMQYTEIQRLENDFIVSLGQVMERSFSTGLEQHVGPLREAIDKLAAGLSTQNEDAMSAMLRHFVERLEGSAGENMRGTAATLENLGARLDGLQTGIDAAAQRMGRAAEDMAAGMGRGAESAMAAMTEQMGSLLARLRETADEAGSCNRAAGDDLARRMEVGAANLTTAMSRAADTVAQTLGGGAADVSQRLVQATEQMRDDLRAVLDRVGRTLEEGREALASGARAGGSAMSEAASAFGNDIALAAQRLRDAGEAAAGALREGGAEARSGMTESARTLVGGTGGLATAAALLAERIAALDQTARAVATPLASSAADFRAAGEAARSAGEPMVQSARSMANLLDRLETASTAMTRLVDELHGATARFEGVDDKMAGVFSRLTGGLGEIERHLTSFVREMDEGLAKSTRGLTAIASSLENTIEELAPAFGSGRANAG